MSGSKIKRKPITVQQRFRILQRDGFRCTYCGLTSADARLEIDHKVAVSLGGSNEDDNLLTSCYHCNAGKGPHPKPVHGLKRGRNGGRPEGPKMPCGWCGTLMTSAQMRIHFTNCPKKPEAKPARKETRYDYSEET